MKHLIRVFLAAVTMALMLPAHAGFIVTTDLILGIPANNDFNSQLGVEGLSHFSQGPNQTLDISGAGTIEFFFSGKEAGFDNTFTSTIAGISDTKSGNHAWQTTSLGSGLFNIGDLMGDIGFSGDGLAASVASNGFGIFLAGGATLAGSDIGNVLYFGYDDQSINTGDDNHDDYMVRAEFTASVPEPSVVFLLGLGILGLGFSSRRRKGVVTA